MKRRVKVNTKDSVLLNHVDKQKRQVLIFMDKKGALSLWIKQYVWHKWLPRTPKMYADSMAKTLGQKPDYGPCFWGMHDESPEQKGLRYVGILDEDTKPIL